MTGPNAHWWITAVVMLGFTTAGLSVTVVNLAFPKIMSSLRADLDTMQWVQTGYYSNVTVHGIRRPCCIQCCWQQVMTVV